MTRKMVIYVDYENVLRTAQGAFPPTDLEARVAQLQSRYARDSSNVQVSGKTLRLTELAQAISRQSIAAPKIGSDKDLFIHEVRVYRGDPEGKRPKVQQYTWTEDDVPDQTWTTRPLVKLWPTERGANDRTKGEKGIDSSLALDFAEAVCEGSYDDIFVIVSSDKDVLSVLEHEPVRGIINDVASPLIQIAGWKPGSRIEMKNMKKAGQHGILGNWYNVENCKEFGTRIDALPLSRRDYNNIIVD